MPKLSSNARQSSIRELLSSNPSLTIPELANHFAVSEMTIRRDLDVLHKSGDVERVHGGAVIAERFIFEFDFRDRRAAMEREKQAIAEEAFKLIKPGQIVMLDNGTTTFELACLLKDSIDITVITPSLAVVSILQFSPKIEVILLGGVLRQGSPDLTGPLTEHCLETLSADISFQGADAISLDGSIYNQDLRLARVDKLMRRISEKTYILADSSKIGKRSLAKSGNISETAGLITDSGINRDELKKLKSNGANIHVCPLIKK